jgi:DUF1680 family protein
MSPCEALPLCAVRLADGIFRRRAALNRKYLLSLSSASLLQNHLAEAGLSPSRQLRATMHGELDGGDDLHWGWESPTCQVRGQFLGHWLSAAAHLIAADGDAELKVKADSIVAELARCQARHGNGWVASIPENYLRWTAAGHPTWAPQYVVHKTLLGLHDMSALAGSKPALEILLKAAAWFHRWTGGFSRRQMDDLLDVETGGLLELWANLYGSTRHPKHRELIERYTRARLFNPLLAGKDALTNRHANTTIPEAHGAARAFEVIGEKRFRRIVEAYWKCAVTDRGYFCTGGQNAGEMWTPPFALVARRGDKNQEHCTVYNMIRLADYLLRWTGDARYADYIERNLWNGILAQQHPVTGMVTYFLPMQAGGRKIWGSPTNDFWCCHGTLVQAQASHARHIYFKDAAGFLVSQYIPSELKTEWKRAAVRISLALDPRKSDRHRPRAWHVNLTVKCSKPVTFSLKLRLPEWLAGPARLTLNGKAASLSGRPPCFAVLERTWHKDELRLELPKQLTACPLPDEPGTVAFLDGPVVLAGICDEERALVGDAQKPETILAPDNEMEWATWLPRYRAIGQRRGLRFLPLHEITDEYFTLYFPIVPRH